ncbi:hypothetical protein CsatB_006557 [Cannabis sativa]
MKLNNILILIFSLFCVFIWFDEIIVSASSAGTRGPFQPPITLTSTPQGPGPKVSNYENSERIDHRCGPDFGDIPCNPGRCCSVFQFCGDTAEYCEGSCKSQCWAPPN